MEIPQLVTEVIALMTPVLLSLGQHLKEAVRDEAEEQLFTLGKKIIDRLRGADAPEIEESIDHYESAPSVEQQERLSEQLQTLLAVNTELRADLEAFLREARELGHTINVDVQQDVNGDLTIAGRDINTYTFNEFYERSEGPSFGITIRAGHDMENNKIKATASSGADGHAAVTAGRHMKGNTIDIRLGGEQKPGLLVRIKSLFSK